MEGGTQIDRGNDSTTQTLESTRLNRTIGPAKFESVDVALKKSLLACEFIFEPLPLTVMSLFLNSFCKPCLSIRCCRRLKSLRKQALIQETNRQFLKDTEIKRLIRRVNSVDALVKSALVPDRKQ